MDPQTTVMTKAQGKERPEVEMSRIAKLTSREREIILLVCEGLKDKQIGECLSLETTSVRGHIGSILSKLGVSDRFELIIYAYAYGLALPPAGIDTQGDRQARGREAGEST